MAKILHLTSTLAAAGAETMMISIITNDTTNTHIVCSVYPGGMYREQLEAKNIRTTSLGMTSPLFIPLALIRFFFTVIRERPNIIHSYLFLDNLFARIIGKILGKKVICSKRDSDREKPWFVGIINRLTAWLADKTVTNFTDGIGELRRDGVREEKIAYIPNGKRVIDYAALSREEARKDLKIPNDVVVITFTGRLVWYKGQEYLLRAFAKVRERHPNVYLLLAGDGRKRNEYRLLAHTLGLGERVQFLGTRSDIARILAATDIFASPSLRDGMPGVIMEAMAAGLPVVATDADGSKDLIKHEKNGILVPVRNSGMIAEKIIELIENKGKRMELGERAKETIKNEFTVERMIARYAELYKSLTL